MPECTPASVTNYAAGRVIRTTPLGSFGGLLDAASVWNRALSDAEVRAAYNFLSGHAAASSITLATPRIYIAEGDSLTGGFTFCYPYLFGPNASPSVQAADYGTSGATLSTLNSRAATIDAIIPPNPGSRKFILSVLLGANDLSGTNSTFAADLATYCDARRAAGWKVVVCTVLPSTGGQINTQRGAVNTAIRTWTGVHADAIADFASDGPMGPDAAASKSQPPRSTKSLKPFAPSKTTSPSKKTSPNETTALDAIRRWTLLLLAILDAYRDQRHWHGNRHHYWLPFHPQIVVRNRENH